MAVALVVKAEAVQGTKAKRAAVPVVVVVEWNQADLKVVAAMEVKAVVPDPKGGKAAVPVVVAEWNQADQGMAAGL